MMTKKHYVRIAAEINAPFCLSDINNPEYIGHKKARSEIASNLANYFASENPKFDRARFLAACGVEQTPCGVQS